MKKNSYLDSKAVKNHNFGTKALKNQNLDSKAVKSHTLGSKGLKKLYVRSLCSENCCFFHVHE